MKIMRREKDWNSLVLVLDGHITETREVIPSNVKTVVHLDIEDVSSIFDQIAAIEDYEKPIYWLNICGESYMFCLQMITELQDVIQHVWFDYEYCGT